MLSDTKVSFDIKIPNISITKSCSDKNIFSIIDQIDTCSLSFWNKEFGFIFQTMILPYFYRLIFWSCYYFSFMITIQKVSNMINCFFYFSVWNVATSDSQSCFFMEIDHPKNPSFSYYHNFTICLWRRNREGVQYLYFRSFFEYFYNLWDWALHFF